MSPLAVIFVTVFIDLLGFGIIIPLLPFYAESFGANAFTVSVNDDRGLIAAGGLSWFGRLPGDIRWSGGSTRVYVPITTMILLSLGLSVVSYLLRRFF